MPKNQKNVFFSCLILLLLIFTLFQLVTFLESKGKLVSDKETFEITQAGNIKVIVWNTILQDWVKQVLGNLGTVESIVTGAQDIHSYEYTASDIQKVVDADIFIKMGIPGVEPHADDLIRAALPDNLKLLNYTLLNTTIDPINGVEIQYDPLIEVNNPHIWMSPYNAKRLINVTYLKLSEFNSTLEPQFRANRDAYFEQLDGLFTRIEGYKVLLNNTPIVSNHPAFKYLFELLGIKRIGVIEEHEGGEASAQHLNEILANMSTYNCKLVVTNPQHSDDHAISMAREISECKIGYLTPLLYPEWDVNNYIKMIDYDLWALEFPRNPPEDSSYLFWIIIIGSIAIVGVIVYLLYLRYRTIE